MPSNLAKAQSIPQVQTSIQFLGFTPDLDPVQSGGMPDMANLYATNKGFRSYPSLTVHSLNTLPSPCIGAFAGYLGNQFVIAAGTVDDLYLFNSGTALWVAQGLAITGGVTRWRFDIYGNFLIAVNGVDRPFAYDGSGNFTPLAGTPPVAGIVQATDYDLFLIPPNSNEFWFSLSATIWTPSVATQTVHGNISATHGNIVGAQKIRNGIVFYGNDGLVLGVFTQPPAFWDFRTISQEVGVTSHEAVANLGDVHYFPGNDDFYYFDGYSLNRIPNNLKEWFFDRLDGDYRHKIIARWDVTKNLIFWHFPSVQANPVGSLDTWIALNLRNGKWSADTTVTGVEWPIFDSVPFSRLTYDVFQSRYPAYQDVANNSLTTYGELLRARDTNVPAVIGTDHALQIYNGVPGQSSFHTHMIGNRLDMFEIQRARPQFSIYPTGGVVLHIHKQYTPGLDDPPTGLVAQLSNDGWFNFRSTARLQQLHPQFQGDFEIVALELDADYVGVR